MKRLITALAVSTALTGIAFAATTDGTLGDTSTGTLDVTLTVNAVTPVPQIQITGLDAISFSTDVGSSSPVTSKEDAFCVYMDIAGETFSIEITTPPLAYSDTSNGNATYQASFRDPTGVFQSGILVIDAERTTTYTDLTPSNVVDCGGGQGNVGLRVEFPNNNPARTVADTATTEIRIVVSPDA